MKKWIVCFVCVFLLSSLPGCRPDPDLILMGSEAVSAADERTPSKGSESLSAGESMSGQKSISGQTDPSGQAESSARQDPEGSADIFVYICGAVKNPGVYEMEPDSRVYELVEAAGGLAGEAAGDRVNLAETVSDGQMVRIPFVSEEIPDGETADAPAGMSADGRVNINTASAEQLMTLSGIGQTKADQIIAYREANGAFPDTEAIMQVSGIAEGTYEKIKDSITVQ